MKITAVSVLIIHTAVMRAVSILRIQTQILPVGTLQKFLDKYLAENGGKIDYIHGNDVVRNLAKADNTIGFMVDSMEKNDLFTTVIKDGSLPRKTFSMGEAADKRFYLECKKIR